MMYNNFSIVDYQKSEDENKAIQKLTEHRDIKLMYDVKVIGVTDHYDSTKENNDLFAFESIFAEMYAADISKKVTAYKRNKGTNGGVVKTRPVYGYKIAPDTKDEWIIDEKVAGIVYMIFDKFVNEEMTEYQIANYLRKHKDIPSSPH